MMDSSIIGLFGMLFIIALWIYVFYKYCKSLKETSHNTGSGKQ